MGHGTYESKGGPLPRLPSLQCKLHNLRIHHDPSRGFQYVQCSLIRLFVQESAGLSDEARSY